MYICGMAANHFYFTEQGLKTISEAIQTGTLSVYYGDKRVEYRSLDHMVRTRNMILRALGYALPQVGRVYAEFGKGIHQECREGGNDWGGGDNEEWLYYGEGIY